MRDPRIDEDWCLVCHAIHGVGECQADTLAEEMRRATEEFGQKAQLATLAERIPEREMVMAHMHAPWLYDEPEGGTKEIVLWTRPER